MSENRKPSRAIRRHLATNLKRLRGARAQCGKTGHSLRISADLSFLLGEQFA